MALEPMSDEAIAATPAQGEELYEYLFRNSPLPIWIAERVTLRLLDVNRAAERLYGYTRDEFLRMTVGDIRAWDPFEAVQRDYAYLALGPENTLERRHRRSDGSAIEVQIRAQALDYHGVPANLVQVVDLTEIREAGREITEREQTFERFLEASLDAVITIDDAGVVRDWRGGAEAIFGFTAKEACGRLLAELVVPERHRDAHLKGLERYRATGEGRILGQRLELSALRKDGSEFPMSLEIAAITRGSRTVFGAFIRDLTNQVRAQEEIQALNTALERRVAERTQELTEANEEMQGFTYSVSHDLRAPLRTIISTSRIMIEDYGAELSEMPQNLLQKQARAAHKLAELIDDLLRYSRIGRQAIQLEQVDLSAAAQAIAASLADSKPERMTEFVIEEGLSAQGDTELLTMALHNLLENAFKFSRGVEGARIEFGRESAGRYFVRDNGVGFEMEYVGKLFIPFERLHREEEFEGTGIGLANVKRIVSRHGGQVWAESTPGCGATFYFTLA
jgi:PAS domain S-box-containing protein